MAEEKSDFRKRWEAKARFKPETGWNLVGVDTYEREPGEELYLVGNYPTEGAANKAREQRLKSNPHEVLHVYGPKSAD
jgi:hypothetical protein